ncbi:2-oxoglutarate and Fe(II)-dependent oxygenase superfamily protein isoform 1 [Hibiscus syriacus]|uniref:2-oxoglutarate and Fe(II)-dependent oxygenase superfamily protein isoform 1 n=1 Tax=Hibiscus syriacus TaxID=106335 RepID=A0A6A2WTE8_HIBSY|nr:2-oxoglutarate and Fe(II)-dependent oxygenase superfamily protein isoform 1 [Hibiscus syriacus]
MGAHIPRQQVLDSSLGTNKLPVIVYYHSGGFINCSASSTIFHVFCSNMALQLQALFYPLTIVLLPSTASSGLRDAMEALRWIKTTQEEWLKNMRISAIVFLWVQVREGESELRLINDPIATRHGRLMWELALPIGADRDHEYCNPTAGKGPKLLAAGLRRMEGIVTGCDGDPLIDRQVGLVKSMEERECQGSEPFSCGRLSRRDVMQPAKAEALFLLLKYFILSAS